MNIHYITVLSGVGIHSEQDGADTGKSNIVASICANIAMHWGLWEQIGSQPEFSCD